MNEVKKMYKNAGLSNIWVERYNDGYYEHETRYNSYKEMINNMMKANDWTLTEAQEVAKKECRKEYLPFTAEIQLELIKWLADRFLELSKYKDVANNNKTMYGIRTDIGTYACSHQEKFEEMLAGLINNLWQDLTEEERKQIRGILE